MIMQGREVGLEAFREGARRMLADNLTSSLRGQSYSVQIDSPPSEREDLRACTRAMADRRWGAPTWPVSYGGGGISQAEAAVLREEINIMRN